MPPRFLLSRLFRSEMDRLESLRQLEMQLQTAIPGDKPKIERCINAVVDEISHLSRAIQELRAQHSLAAQS
jgi:hypothetical protein